VALAALKPGAMPGQELSPAEAQAGEQLCATREAVLRDAGKLNADSEWVEWRRGDRFVYKHAGEELPVLRLPEAGVRKTLVSKDGEAFAKNVSWAVRAKALRDAGQLNPQSPWKEWLCDGDAVYQHRETKASALRMPEQGVWDSRLGNRQRFARLCANARRREELQDAGQLNAESPWKECRSDEHTVYRHKHTQAVTLRMPDKGVFDCLHDKPGTFESLFDEAQQREKRGEAHGEVLNAESSWPKPCVATGRTTGATAAATRKALTFRSTRRPKGCTISRSRMNESTRPILHARGDATPCGRPGS